MRGPKPTYARIRIEKLDMHIGRAEALGRDEAVAALKYFARDAGIEINYKRIDDHRKLIEAELMRRRQLDDTQDPRR